MDLDEEEILKNGFKFTFRPSNAKYAPTNIVADLVTRIDPEHKKCIEIIRDTPIPCMDASSIHLPTLGE